MSGRLFVAANELRHAKGFPRFFLGCSLIPSKSLGKLRASLKRPFLHKLPAFGAVTFQLFRKPFRDPICFVKLSVKHYAVYLDPSTPRSLLRHPSLRDPCYLHMSTPQIAIGARIPRLMLRVCFARFQRPCDLPLQAFLLVKPRWPKGCRLECAPQKYNEIWYTLRRRRLRQITIIP